MYQLTDGWPKNVQSGAFVNPESEQYAAWLAAGNTPLPADVQPRNIAAEIDALERKELLPRPVRDSLLAIAEKEAAALGITPTQLETLNAGYRKVKALHQQISELRALL